MTAEQFHFHRCIYAAGESVANFNVALRMLATNCEFGGTLEEALSDWFVGLCVVYDMMPYNADFFQNMLYPARKHLTLLKEWKLLTAIPCPSKLNNHRLTKIGIEFHKGQRGKPATAAVQEAISPKSVNLQICTPIIVARKARRRPP